MWRRVAADSDRMGSEAGGERAMGYSVVIRGRGCRGLAATSQAKERLKQQRQRAQGGEDAR